MLFYKRLSPVDLFYIGIWFDVAGSVIHALIHRISVEVGGVSRHAAFFFALLVGDSLPSRGNGWILDVFGHGELRES